MKNNLRLSRYNTRYYHDYPDAIGNDYPETKSASVCAGCNCQIHDQYLLKVAPDLDWHIQCLKCSECGLHLDEATTCFVLDGKTFCKYDYIRLFASQCAKCHEAFSPNELFTRTTCYRRYHLDCFRCQHCDRLLVSGDEYYIDGQNEILCRQDFHQLNASNLSIGPLSAVRAFDDMVIGLINDCLTDFNRIDMYMLSKRVSIENSSHDQSDSSTSDDIYYRTNHTNNIPLRPPPTSSSSSSTTSSSSNQPIGSTIIRSSSTMKSMNNVRKDKTTRMRTVLNEKQLLTLRTCYSANPRPDALIKEQLVDMTQLSPRVIRVWFQNKRCKDKKRSILVKQTQEQQKVLSSLNHGLPLVASSPVANDMNVGLPPASRVRVQYHAGGPWKTLSAYPNGHHHIQAPQQNFHDMIGFGSEDDSTCFEASQYSEERSDTSCDGSGTSQLTLL